MDRSPNFGVAINPSAVTESSQDASDMIIPIKYLFFVQINRKIYSFICLCNESSLYCMPAKGTVDIFYDVFGFNLSRRNAMKCVGIAFSKNTKKNCRFLIFHEKIDGNIRVNFSWLNTTFVDKCVLC